MVEDFLTWFVKFLVVVIVVKLLVVLVASALCPEVDASPFSQ